MSMSADELNRMALELVVDGMKKLTEAAKMMKTAETAKKKEEKDFTNDNPAEEVKEVLSECVSTMTGQAGLVSIIRQTVSAIAQEMIILDGIKLDFEGVKIEILKEPPVVYAEYNPDQPHQLPENFQ